VDFRLGHIRRRECDGRTLVHAPRPLPSDDASAITATAGFEEHDPERQRL